MPHLLLRSPNRRRPVVLAGLASLALTLPMAAPAEAAPSTSLRLRNAVTLDGLLEHTRALQQIADVNDNNRASGTTGYAASAGYVMGQLKAAGYDVRLHPFTFPFFAENAAAEFERITPDPETFEQGEDFATMTYSGSGEAQATVELVDVELPPPAQAGTSDSGCEAEDFAGFTRGNIALIQRGTCTFQLKAENAQAAGASAVIIMNEGQPGRTDVLSGTLGAPTVSIPVLGTSFAVGRELAGCTDTGCPGNPTGVVARIETDTTAEERTTYNVIAETRGGRSDNVVMLGAHLDSVADGPGINDNASGSAALLEVATAFAKVVKKPRNKVRFAWWGAEEFGLLGSEAYVDSLTTAQRSDIALYLNFDMIASPNFVRFIYDGDDSDKVGAGAGPEGSAAIEDVFENYFDARDLPTEGTDFTGRSDYGPFIAVGIPSGGLFTGAEGIKTPEQEAIYGGRAGVAYDPCYHEPCDTTLRNLSYRVFIQNADAIAHATAVFAASTEAVNGRSAAANKLRLQQHRERKADRQATADRAVVSPEHATR